MKWTIALSLIYCLALGNAYGDQYGYTWKPLRIGAGGWVTGIDISSDGSTRVVRTDTYGAYVWDDTQWKQLVTTDRMPAQDVGVEMGAGVYEICVAPGDANRLYMSYRGRVYRSDDRGDSWTRTTFPQVGMLEIGDFMRIQDLMASKVWRPFMPGGISMSSRMISTLFSRRVVKMLRPIPAMISLRCQTLTMMD